MASLFLWQARFSLKDFCRSHYGINILIHIDIFIMLFGFGVKKNCGCYSEKSAPSPTQSSPYLTASATPMSREGEVHQRDPNKKYFGLDTSWRMVNSYVTV